MTCPKCGGQTDVIDSRAVVRSHTGLTNTIRRRRKCLSCAETFTTFEIPQTDARRIAELAREVEKVEKAKDMFRDLLAHDLRR